MADTQTKQSQLAKVLGVSTPFLSEFLNCKTGLSVAVYQRLSSIVTPEPTSPNNGCRIVHLQCDGKRLKGSLTLEREDIDKIIQLSIGKERQAVFEANINRRENTL